MLASMIHVAALLASLASALPTHLKRDDFSDFSPDGKYFPLKDGFPNPSNDQIPVIQKQAAGTLPTSPPPPALSSEGVTNLQLLALNELFEVAFFSELVYNVSNKFPGYDLGYGHEYVMDSLTAIVAQEELHLLAVNGLLTFFKQTPIEPCKYAFPVTDFQSAIALAGTFTDVVLGTLQDVNEIFAKNGDPALVRTISSVIGNEAEQQGVFRLVQNKRIAAQPFLTTADRDFAFTAIQSFTVPDSCPNIDAIELTTFQPLNVLTTDIKPQTQKIKFSAPSTNAGGEDPNAYSVVWINQQNQPAVAKLENPSTDGNNFVFEAELPYDRFLMNGLTIAAVVKGSGPFATAGAVADATVWGPGLIEID